MNVKSLFWIFLIVFVVYFTLCLSGDLNLVFSPSSEASVGSRLVIGGPEEPDVLLKFLVLGGVELLNMIVKMEWIMIKTD